MADRPATIAPTGPGADAATKSFIRVRNLTKRFGGFLALDDVSIAEGQGGTLALLGPSGCGKTTMLRCIAGLETPSQGLIEIGGRVVFDSARGIDLKPETRALGVVFQSYAVWPHMSVAANVGFPLKVRRVPKSELDARVDRILDMVGLSAWRDKPATELSGGQQQRVALARALIHEPSLVLFDEPMSNLDAQLRDQMRLELKLLQQQLNFTAIYVTHDQSEAFALAQTVVVMNRGRIETVGPPEEVVRRPKTPFIARFLGYNVVEGRILASVPRTDASGSWVQVALGGQATLWGQAGAGLDGTPGTRAVLCVRREHVAVGIGNRGAAQPPGAARPPARRLVPGIAPGIHDRHRRRHAARDRRADRRRRRRRSDDRHRARGLHRSAARRRSTRRRGYAMTEERVVAVYGHTFPNLDVETAVLAARGIRLLDANALTPDDMAKAGVTGIILGTLKKVDVALLAAMPALTAVVRQGMGVDNIDIPAATARGIPVCNVNDYCVEEVAVHALACALSLMRKLAFFDANMRAGLWRKGMVPMIRPSTATVGIIGYGQVGRAFAARARAIFGTLLVHDPFASPGGGDVTVKFVADLDDLLARSDVVTVHAPLTPQTKGLIGAEGFARMKTSAVVINASRGGIIDEAALLDALRDGRIAGAALDTFSVEPLPQDHALMREGRVILSPHIAWLSTRAEYDLREHAAQEMVRVLFCEKPHSQLNKV